jgi:hypothetical protein
VVPLEVTGSGERDPFIESPICIGQNRCSAQARVPATSAQLSDFSPELPGQSALTFLLTFRSVCTNARPPKTRKQAQMADGEAEEKPTHKVFESYGRADASELAERIESDLAAEGYQVWRDVGEVHAGGDFMTKIELAIESSDVMVALLSPHAVRLGETADQDSVCRDEIAKARFGTPKKPIVPVMAVECQPPLAIYRLTYVDMTRWQEPDAYEVGLAELKRGIAAALSGKESLFDRAIVTALDPLDFGAFLNTKRQSFQGREWLFEEIEAWRNRDGERVLLITGDPGSGKSAVVAELVYRNPGGQVVAYHCCRSSNPATRQPGKFVRSIAAMLASQIPEYSAAIERGRANQVLREADADPQSAFEHGVIAPLCAIDPPPGPARYILIDALDEARLSGGADGTTILDLLHTRTEQLPAWLRVVATTRHERSVLELFRATSETIVLDSQDERNRRDIQDYLLIMMGRPEFAEIGGDDPAEVCARLVSLSDGSFLYAQQVLNSLLHRHLSLSDLSELPPGLTALYDDYFERTFPDDASYSSAREVLGVLIVANGGLSRTQLQGVIGCSQVELEKALAPLSGYLAEEDGRLRLFHRSFVDWLTNPSVAKLRFVIDPTSGRERLLAYCKRWTDLDDDYPLRELPSHLAAARDTDGLLAILTDREFIQRRGAAGVSRHVQLEGYRLLAHLLLANARIDDLARLALTTDPAQRDGLAVALREAPQSSEPVVKNLTSMLVSVGLNHSDDLTPQELNARLIAIRVASDRGYIDLLEALAQDPSAAVRALLVPHLFRFWKVKREEGWKLLDDLAPHFTGRFGVPKEELVETIGGVAIAIVGEFYYDEGISQRLGEYLARLVKQSISSPLRRAVGKGLLLKVGVSALTKIIREQPDYQPMNLSELSKAYPRDETANRRASEVLDVLEHPELPVDQIVRALTSGNPDFDVLLMSIAERALILKGVKAPDQTFEAIRRIYYEGFEWFRQSIMYAISKILETSDPGATDPRWLDLYAEVMADFVKTSRATMTSKTATYSASPALAGIEVVFEQHRPAGRARFLPDYFQTAMNDGDLALAKRVVKAAQLVALLGRPLIALDALDPVASALADHPELEQPLVETLANIKLFEDAAANRFLEDLDEPELARMVDATSPTVSANEFPTMIDFWTNHQLINSEDGRAEIGEAYRRALGAKSSSQVIYDVIVWVTGLLAGTDLG